MSGYELTTGFELTEEGWQIVEHFSTIHHR